MNGAAQQQHFDRWRKDFNEERPHGGLGMRMPADVYHPSAKRLDKRVKPRLYPLDTEIRRMNVAGFIGMEGESHRAEAAAVNCGKQRLLLVG